MTAHSEPAGCNAAEQYEQARARHMQLIFALRALDDPAAAGQVRVLSGHVHRLTTVIAQELVPYQPLSWSELYSSRPRT